MGQADTSGVLIALLQHEAVAVNDVPNIGHVLSTGAPADIVEQAEHVRTGWIQRRVTRCNCPCYVGRYHGVLSPGAWVPRAGFRKVSLCFWNRRNPHCGAWPVPYGGAGSQWTTTSTLWP